jgi:hypothetical protein
MPPIDNNTPNHADKSIVSQETMNLRTEIMMFCEAVTAVTITTPEEYQSAGEMSKIVAGYLRDIESRRVDEVKPHLEAQREINGFVKPIVESLNHLKNTIGSAIYDYNLEQERIRREKQRKLDEEKRQKEAEAKRAAEQARRQAEEARIAAEQARKQGEENQAGAAEQEAEILEATAMELEFEEVVPTVVEIPEASKLSGVHVRHNWTAEITDDNAFVKWAVDNKEYELLAGDVKKLRAKAKMIKREQKYPGAKIYDKASVVTKTN